MSYEMNYKHLKYYRIVKSGRKLNAGRFETIFKLNIDNNILG